MRRKILFIAGAAAVLAVSVLLVYSNLRPYRIGVVLLQNASVVQEQYLASRFYAEKLEKIGMHPLKVIFKSPDSGEEALRQSCRELVAENVSVIIGGSISSEGVIIADELKDSGIPVLGVTASTGSLSDLKDNFFRIAISAFEIGKCYGSHFNSKGYSSVTVIRAQSNQDYTGSLSEGVKSVFNGRISESFFEPEAIYTADSNDDAVLAICTASELIQIIKSIRIQSPDFKIYATDWGFDELLSLFSIPEMEGVLSLSRVGAIEDSNRKLLDEYHEQMQIKPTFGALTVIRVMDICRTALIESGDSPEAIIDYFSTPRFYDSGYGRIYMNEYGDSIPENMFLRQIVDSEIVIIEEIRNADFPEK